MRKRIKKILLILGIIILILALFFWYFIIGMKTNKSGANFNKGKNAVWIAHSWVWEKHSEAEIKSLVEKLTKHRIKYVFVHSGPLNKEGEVPAYRYNYAQEFIKTAKKISGDKEMKWLAWLGQLKSKLPYADPNIREKIALTSQFFVYNLGFDGIHFDIEPIVNGDEAFLLLLQETQKKLDETKIISVASEEWRPKYLTKLAAFLLKKKIVSYWTTDYFRKISKYADQIVVMAYDTGLKKKGWYKWFIEQQVIYAASAVLPGKELLIGIPAYEYAQKTKFFDQNVENIKTGLMGIITGLNNIRSNKKAFAGVAIYPEWQIDEKEWEVYNKLWGDLLIY